MEQTAVSISAIFEATGEVIAGVVEGGLNYLSTMWSNPFGQVAIVIGLAGTVIYFGKGLFTKKKHI